MVMQTGYFDDSGSHAASQYYVLAGFVAPVSDWKLVSDEWAHTINEEGLSYFKMSHAMAMDGQFKRGWTIPLRDQLILKLVKANATPDACGDGGFALRTPQALRRCKHRRLFVRGADGGAITEGREV